MPVRDRKTHRIAIVGAGASGIVCARELRSRGWESVALLEARSEPGGRTRSVTLRNPVNGREEVIEQGTFFVLRGPVLKALIRDTGMGSDLTEYPRGRFRRLSEGRDYHPFLSGTPGIALPRKFSESARYLLEMRRFRSLERPGFRGLPGTGLSVPIEEWFRARDFRFLREAILPVAAVILCGNGLERVPAAYLLKLEHYRMRLPAWRNAQFALTRFGSGNQELWRRAARGLDLRLGQAVRGVLPGDGGVRVRTQSGESVFDSVIWTTNPVHLSQAMNGHSETDGRPSRLAKVRYLRRAMCLYRAEGLPRNVFRVLSDQALKQVSAMPYAFINWPGTDWYGFYPWMSDDQTAEDLERGVHETVRRLGGKVLSRCLEPVIWDYLPYFESREIEAGIYEELEREQGRDGIYLCGEAVAGLSLPAVTEYAKELVERFF